MRATGKGITATLVERLELVTRRKAYQTFLAPKGKLDLDLDRLRERPHR